MAGSVSIGSLFATLEVRDVSGAARTNFQRQIKEIETSTVRASRTTKSETDKINEAYRKVAASLDPVVARTQRYERQVETLNSALKAGIINQAQYNHQLSLAQSKLEVATHWTSRLGGSIGTELRNNLLSTIGVTALITAGLGAIVSISKKIIEVNLEKEKTERLLEAAILRSANAQEISKREALGLADSLSRLTGVDDDAIAGAEAVALRYNRISSKIFPDVTRAALDLSAATGEDLNNAMEKVAKAVNSPLRGLTILAREGYAVSASQTKVIKDLLASNRIMEAQAEILSILQDRYGGTAAEVRDTMTGALTALGTTWENFLERVGQDNMGPLRQALESIISLLETATDRVSDFETGWHSLRAIVNGATANILRNLISITDALSRLVPGDAGKGYEILTKRLQEGLKVADQNRVESLFKAIRATSGLADGQRKGARAALEQTEAERKLTDQLKALRDQALKVLESSRLEREKAEGLLQARYKGIAAMRLEESVQRALEKARSAGTGATSAERLEIVRNTLAIDAAKNRIEAVNQAQKDWDEQIKASTDNLVLFLGELEKVYQTLGDISDSFLSGAVNVNVQQVQTGGQLATETTRERLQTAREWRESWRTAREVANAEISRVGDSLLTLAEKERAITEIRIGLVEHYADAWVSFFGFLGGMFDGVIAQIANAFSQMQSAYQSFSGLGKSMGMDASAASGLGYFGVFVAIVDIAHSLLEAHKLNQRNRQWMLSAQALGDRDRFGEWQIGAAQDAHLNVSKASRDASNAINTAMEEIAAAIGGVLKTFEDITINIRRDGKYFQALVGQQVIGIYESFEAAMEAALQASLLAADTIITGLSDLVQQGLSELRSGAIGRTSDLDQIVDFLSALKEISELGLPQGAVQMQELTRHFDELWHQLTRMNEVTEATTQGFVNLIGGESDAWLDWSRSIRGVQQTRQEELEDRKREADLFNKMKPVRIAELNLQILEWKQKAEALRIRGQIVRGGAVLDQGDIQAKVAYLQAKGTLVKAETDLVNQYIEFINQIIKAIEDLIASLEAIPDINIGDIKLPRVGGAGSGKDQVRDFIADRRFDLSTRGMTDYQRAIAELDRTYAPLLEQAGKDINLRNQLLALKREEIALLEHEQRVRTSESFQQFVNPDSQFDAIRKTASDLIAEIEASPFGNERKARMVARVLAEIDEQITNLSMQEAGSLLGDLAGGLEKFGLDSQLQSQLRMNAAVIEHQLNLQNYRERIALLKAEGKIAPEIIRQMEIALGKLEAVDVRTAIVDDGRRFRGYEDEANRLETSTERVNSELNRLAESFARAKDSIRSTLDDIARGELGIVAPERAFEAARSQFEGMLASSRAGELIGFEEADSTTREYIEALKRFSPQLAATELPRIQEELRSLLDIQTVRDENLVYSERFAVGQEAANKTLVAGFNDLSNKSQEQSIIQSRMLEQIRQLNESNAELNSKLARLEASQQAERRAA